MNYLHSACLASKTLFNKIQEIEAEHKNLLQSPDDPEELIDIPRSKEDYIDKTGRNITDDDYKVIIVLQGLYNALLELDGAIEAAGGYNLQQQIYRQN